MPKRTSGVGVGVEKGKPELVGSGKGGFHAVVQLFRVPDRSIFFEELEDFFEYNLGVGGVTSVRQLEAVTGEFWCSVLEVQDFLRCRDPI